jgi:hypothetical protein
MGYADTLIAVAEDCPVRAAEIPAPRGDRLTVAVVQYRMLAEHPHRYTQEDVLFESWLRRQDPPEQTEAQRAALRERFFAKPQACLRASPLPKRHGWGLLFDDEGRVALCAMESSRYRDILAGADPQITVLKAMRTRR